MEIDLKRLGENIRYLRQGKHWSLNDLAEASKVSKAYISDLENGSGGRPNIQYLYAIATTLGTSLDGLVNESLSSPERRTNKRPVTREQLPPGLEEFARITKLEPDEVDMLAKLNFRGNRPRDLEAWKLIYDAIKIASRG